MQMKNHTSKEAFYERLRNLAEVKKPLVKESTNRTLGTLIDYKRAADGVAYGIIKENHLYYVKKAGTKQDLSVSDFAYIGGLSNITNFQYRSLAEADKQRNMMFHTISEAITLKPNKNGSKKRLNEDKAGQEIDQAASKLGDLDAAAGAAEMPAPSVDGAEMAAGLESEPADAPAEMPAPEGGEELPAEPAPEGGEELPAEMPAPEGGEELPTEDPTAEPAPEGGEEPAPDAEGSEEPAADADGVDAAVNNVEDGNEQTRELDKAIGKITNTIRKTELEPAQTKSYINSFIAAFKDKLPEIEIEDRKEMANRLIKIVNPDEIENLGDSLPPEEQTPAEDELAKGGVEEEQCAECGSFAKYAESRGYDANTIRECGEEEVGNLVSGYANAHNDGQNDGDLEGVALVVKIVNPEILKSLKSDYGHEDYANKLEPVVNGMNESSEEDDIQKLNELFGGLKNLGKAAGNAIGGGLKAAGSAIADKATQGAQAVKGAAKDMYQAGAEKVGQAKQAIGQAATSIKQTYNAGEINPEVKKLEGVAADLGKQIAALNKRMVGAGQQPINVKSILATIQNQVGAGGQANLSKFKTATSEGVGVDPSNTVVSEPNMLKEEDEELENDELEIGGEETPEGGEESTEEFSSEETPEVSEPEEKKDNFFAPASQSLGVATVKPDGAATTALDISISPDKTVNISMNEAKRKLIKQIAEGVNEYMAQTIAKPVEVKKPEPISESEQKLRKYIRVRLEEKAGLRKSGLNESKKSPALKKLDATIDEQFKLYESVVKKKVKK